MTTDHHSSPVDTKVLVHRDASGDVVVHITGELLSGAAADLTLLITDQLLQRPPHMVIDVSEVAVIDAVGANALLLTTGMAARHDVPLSLRGARGGGPVHTVLHNLDLLDLFECR